jgi:NAD(P)-dependent dehydrogenase (short-subunit alcohol dehydrogenase family)
MNEKKSLRGLRVVVTGGTAGLGRALVETLTARGARVGFVARRRERVERVEREVAGSVGVVGDVASKDDVHPIALQLSARLGGVDVLIHNASSLGPVPLRPLADTDCEDLERALATNVLGPFRLTKALLGALVASASRGVGGLVIAISSDAAVTPYPGWGAYGASKAALAHLTAIWDGEEMARHRRDIASREAIRGGRLHADSLGVEGAAHRTPETQLSREGVRFVSIDPGDMDTELHAIAIPDADRATLKRPETSAEEIADRIAERLHGAAIAHAEAPS